MHCSDKKLVTVPKTEHNINIFIVIQKLFFRKLYVKQLLSHGKNISLFL